jgi:D-alanyl-D-alanine carboxypeptidase
MRSILISIALFAFMSSVNALTEPLARAARESAANPSAGQPASPSLTAPPLPACRYGDVRTPLSGYDDWALTLVDTWYTLPADYEPPDLVDARLAGLESGQKVRSIMIPDLRAMVAQARRDGASLSILSGYRSYRTQAATFVKWVGVLGPEKAPLGSARAGHSEHQLGLAIDFQARGGPDPWAYPDWSKSTLEGRWLAAHAWEYGFVMSYPANHKSPARTCYGYEPWHYRWVGRAEAAAVRDSGLALREWLWRHQPR